MHQDRTGHASKDGQVSLCPIQGWHTPFRGQGNDSNDKWIVKRKAIKGQIWWELGTRIHTQINQSLLFYCSKTILHWLYHWRVISPQPGDRPFSFVPFCAGPVFHSEGDLRNHTRKGLALNCSHLWIYFPLQFQSCIVVYRYYVVFGLTYIEYYTEESLKNNPKILPNIPKTSLAV
jgi:hypothetical protein